MNEEGIAEELALHERIANLEQALALADLQLAGYLELLQEQAVQLEELKRELWYWQAVCFSVLTSRKTSWLSGQEKGWLEQLEQERERETE